MPWQFSFQNAQLMEVRNQEKELELGFSAINIIAQGQSQIISDQKIIARLQLGQCKFKSLPKKGLLTDGELYGVPGKALNGMLPIPLDRQGDFELTLSFEDKDYTIFCKKVQLIIDPKCLPLN